MKMTNTNEFKVIKNCNVCGSGDLESIFDTPQLPLTGVYLNPKDSITLPCFDQSFIVCHRCGHGQLLNVINPNILYNDTYTHRSSSSSISTQGNDFFEHFLRQIVGKNQFESVLEVGCNDLYLLDKIQDLGSNFVGIDPIWAGKDFEHNKKTHVLGRFVEDFDVETDIKHKPNLVISAHTFEHIGGLREQFEHLVTLAADDCLFVIEMPSFDSMIKTRRFDQIFHQHIQYLSLTSMVELIKQIGCQYLAHQFNYSYWGGTLLFSFKKTPHLKTIDKPKFESLTMTTIENNFRSFKTSVISTVDQASKLMENCYGFGAAQMLPVLAYHAQSDLSFMQGILDDNPNRVGTQLPGVASPIISVAEAENLTDSAIMITALDSMRPIMKKVIELNPRRIMSPIQLF